MPMPRDVMYLSDDQFNKLVELLTPGYELAKAYMAEMAARQPLAAAPPEEPPAPPAHDADAPPAA